MGENLLTNIKSVKETLVKMKTRLVRFLNFNVCSAVGISKKDGCKKIKGIAAKNATFGMSILMAFEVKSMVAAN